MTACHVFIDEISRVRQLRGTWPDAPHVEDELMENYRNGLKAMSLFSQDSTLMRKLHFCQISTTNIGTEFLSFLGYQLTKVQEAFEAI
jgi:hypothetical protein